MGPGLSLSVRVPRSAWKTKKPVALGWSFCVDGRNAPIGFVGDAENPRYGSSCPDVNAVWLSTVALNVPPPETLMVKGPTPDPRFPFGVKMSTRKLPVAGPGDTEKPKFVGGFEVIGVFVP